MYMNMPMGLPSFTSKSTSLFGLSSPLETEPKTEARLTP